MRGNRGRVTIAAVCGGAASTAALVVACGLDEGGLLGTTLDASSDTSFKDAAADSPPVDHVIPPTCADASCVPDFPADAWAAIGVVLNPTTGCPDGFEARDFVTNPKLAAGACMCGTCAPSGAWQCGGAISISAGSGSCAPDTIFPSATSCVNLSRAYAGTDVQTGVTPPNLAGLPTCSASLSGDGGVVTTPVRACRPVACASDYCGLKGAGYSLCIVHNGDTDGGCPNGFNLLPSTPGTVDDPANVTSACDKCQCGVNVAACTATYFAYSGNNCDAGIASMLSGTFAADASGGTCNDPEGSLTVASIYYAPDPPPAATCTTTTPNGSGSAALKAPSTVCCAP